MTRVQDVQLIELVSKIHRKIQRRLAPLFESEGLSATEIVVLKTMHHRQTCRISELSESSGIPPSTLTGILDRLVAGEWLQRVPDAEDRRSILIRCDPKLSISVERLTAKIETELQAMIGILPAEHYSRLIADLQRILDYLENEQR
ncbi:MAG: MarR family transcriptional regulator [Thermacetogeniaceae bacterium]